jgi:2-polyprenyl-6-methoxyphenol hydroxylase-like FAD-dependent oxidoreductase
LFPGCSTFAPAMKHQTVTITGGGIAGLTTAIALKRIGITAHVFEASPQILPVGAGLGLGNNAMLAFRELDIYDEVMRAGRAIPAFSINDHHGKVITRTTFDNPAVPGSFTIHRAALHQLLLSKLDPATIHTGKRVQKMDQTDFGVKLTFGDGTTHIANYLIVADGIHSVTRQAIHPEAVTRYAGYTCWRSVIDNSPFGIDESSETWGSKGRVGLVPLADNKLYWFACINAPANDPVYRAYNIGDLCNHFAHYHDPIPAILAGTDNSKLLHNDIIDLEPLSRFAHGRIVLTGDAAHATTPNMGQGACQAIEDAVVLAQCMEQQSDYELAFKAFETRRLQRTRWVTNTSFELGKVAQIENLFMIALRNTALRILPASISNKQLRKIENVDFTRN